MKGMDESVAQELAKYRQTEPGRKSNRDRMARYRAKHPEYVERNRVKTRERKALRKAESRVQKVNRDMLLPLAIPRVCIRRLRFFWPLERRFDQHRINWNLRWTEKQKQQYLDALDREWE